MNITIVAAGKLDSGCRLLAAEYGKRLGRFVRLDVREAKDEPQRAGQTEEQVKKREGERLLALLPPGAHVIALCPGPQAAASEEFAARLFARQEAAFVLGGSLGLSAEVLARAHERMSLSNLTFPHGLARVILLEQLYRACKINSHETYHK